MSDHVLSFDDITVGQNLPTLVKRPDIVQSMRVGAATENFHRVHWDREFARHDGLPDVILGTGFLSNMLAQLVTDWIGVKGTLRTLSYRFRGYAHPGDTLTATGSVVGQGIRADEPTVDCRLWIANQHGTRLTEGSATVVLPRPSRAL